MTTNLGKQAIVVGGGLAGMACAVALEGAGWGVTVVEARGSLGGRASSFEDPQSGEVLDNCQHVLLGCCVNLLDFYERIGARGKVAFHRQVHFLDERGGRHDLWAVAGAPAPLHLGPAMAMFSALNIKERRAVVRAMLMMLRMGRRGRDAVEGHSFGDWLEAARQPESVIRKFYDPIVISGLNEETRRASAKYAIQIFQEALLANRRGYVVGLPVCPLGELYSRLPAGMDVRLGARVEEIVWEAVGDGRKATGVRLRGGEEIRGDAVVLATNYHAVQRWVADLPEAARVNDRRLADLDKLESVPILGAHLWFDRPVMREYAVALIGGPLQWLFRKDEGENGGRQIHGVISAARAWVTVPKEEALKQFEQQVRGLFSGAREAKLERGVIVIEKRATFSPLPGTEHFRPVQGPAPAGIQQLFLAGDYTRTDWPATMEGAVRSGYLAAEAITGERFIVPDLPVQWPARMMGL